MTSADYVINGVLLCAISVWQAAQPGASKALSAGAFVCGAGCIVCGAI